MDVRKKTALNFDELSDETGEMHRLVALHAMERLSYHPTLTTHVHGTRWAPGQSYVDGADLTFDVSFAATEAARWITPHSGEAVRLAMQFRTALALHRSLGGRLIREPRIVGDYADSVLTVDLHGCGSETLRVIGQPSSYPPLQRPLAKLKDQFLLGLACQPFATRNRRSGHDRRRATAAVEHVA